MPKSLKKHSIWKRTLLLNAGRIQNVWPGWGKEMGKDVLVWGTNLSHLGLPALPETWLPAHPGQVLVITVSLSELWILHAPACLQASAPSCSPVGELLSAVQYFPPVLFAFCCSQHCQGLRCPWGCGMKASKSTEQTSEDTEKEFHELPMSSVVVFHSGSSQGPFITWRSSRDLWEVELEDLYSDSLPSGFLLRWGFECLHSSMLARRSWVRPLAYQWPFQYHQCISHWFLLPGSRI